MKTLLSSIIIVVLFSIQVAQASEKYTIKQSRFSVDQTIDKLEVVLKQKGFKIFTRVHHSEAAKNVGLNMQDTQLLIFGNPKAGTLLMQETPLMALDLPLKIMAWKDANGQVWIAYVNPSELQRRHHIKNNKLIQKMKKGLNKITDIALGN